MGFTHVMKFGHCALASQQLVLFGSTWIAMWWKLTTIVQGKSRASFFTVSAHCALTISVSSCHSIKASKQHTCALWNPFHCSFMCGHSSSMWCKGWPATKESMQAMKPYTKYIVWFCFARQHSNGFLFFQQACQTPKAQWHEEVMSICDPISLTELAVQDPPRRNARFEIQERYEGSNQVAVVFHGCIWAIAAWSQCGHYRRNHGANLDCQFVELVGWCLPAEWLMGQFFSQCTCKEPKQSTEAMAATVIFRWSGSREPIGCQAKQKGFCHICFFCPAHDHAPVWRCMVHIGIAAIHYSGSVGSQHWPGVCQDYWSNFLGTSLWPKEWLVHATPKWHHGSDAILWFGWLCPRWLGHEANFQYQRCIRGQVLHVLFQHQIHSFGIASRYPRGRHTRIQCHQACRLHFIHRPRSAASLPSVQAEIQGTFQEAFWVVGEGQWHHLQPPCPPAPSATFG